MAAPREPAAEPAAPPGPGALAGAQLTLTEAGTRPLPEAVAPDSTPSAARRLVAHGPAQRHVARAPSESPARGRGGAPASSGSASCGGAVAAAPFGGSPAPPPVSAAAMRAEE